MNSLIEQQNNLARADAVNHQIKNYISNLYLDTQATATGSTAIAEDYIVRLVSRLVVSVCTAWYAILEIINYFKRASSTS